MKAKTPFLVMLLQLGSIAYLNAQHEKVGKSLWGPDDEIGTLNMMDESSKLKILSSIGSSKVYDLSVQYFVGMPSFNALGDPPYQFWLTHIQ